MKPIKAFVLISLAGSSLALAGQGPRPAASGLSDQEPQVVAFYEQQCLGYADARGLAGSDRDGYLQQCRANAPQIWPVGIDESDS
jgi:hypothetical protein